MATRVSGLGEGLCVGAPGKLAFSVHHETVVKGIDVITHALVLNMYNKNVSDVFIFCLFQ